MAVDWDTWLIPAGAVFFHSYYLLLRDFLVRRLFTRWMRPRKDESIKDEQNGMIANGEQKLSNGVSSGTNVEKVQSCSRVEMPDYTVAEIANWIVSGTLGVVTSIASVIIMWQAKHDSNGDSWLLVPYVKAAIWYFVYDTYGMYDVVSRKYKSPTFVARLKMFYKKRLAFIIHHIVVVGTLYKISVDRSYRSGVDDFYVGAFMAREFTNPFLAIASTLKLLNRKDNLLYMISGFTLIVLFFFMRILNTPMLFIMCAIQYHSWNLLATIYRVGLYLNLVLIVEFTMQMFWFLGICDAVRKVICPPGKKKD